jgi:hypothetical protein
MTLDQLVDIVMRVHDQATDGNTRIVARLALMACKLAEGSDRLLQVAMRAAVTPIPATPDEPS